MKWTPEKNALLASVWPSMGKDCVPMFPGHSEKSVSTQANKLEIRRDGWKQPTQSKPAQIAVNTIPTTRIVFHDDEPLVQTRLDKRTARGCYGFIHTGPAPSIWALASAIGGNQ